MLSLGFKPDGFLSAYPDGTCAGVRLHYAVESEPLDTAGAIRFAALTAGFTGETFVALNGDVLTDLDVGELVAFHRRHGAEGSIHLTPVEDPSAFGVVPTREDGQVEAFVEKPPPGEAPTNLINAGTYVLEAAALDRIPNGRKVSIERETFPAMVADGSLYALATDDYWLDAGSPDLYRQANLDMIDGRRAMVKAEPLAADAAVDDAASVRRSVIGAQVRVGAGAVVEGSVVLAGASIEAGARVLGSIIGPGSVVRSGAVLDDVVLGEGVVVDGDSRLLGVRIPDGG